MPQPSPHEHNPSVLDLIATRTGEAPRVTLRDEDSAAASSPVIDPSSKEKTAVPRGRSNYQFLGEIARGGMGVILKGHDTDLGRDVAVKVLNGELAQDAEIVRRFVEEAQIGGQLQHPGIVPVYDLGLLADERPYFTMKLVKGRTLAALFQQRKSPDDNRGPLLAIFESVCQTMAYAHSKGVLHRDLKPSNVMVGAFGEVQVVDWGLAKVLRRGGVADEKRANDSLHTVIATVRSGSSASGSDSMAGSIMGTPAYMAPEQAQGEVEMLDERADVFSLGAILCELLTGRPPYDRINGKPPLAQAAQAKLGPARTRIEACDADPALVGLCLECLLPVREARPANADEVAKAVHAYLTSVEERAHAARAESVAALVRVEEERKARRLTVALGVAVVAILLVGGGSWAFFEKERTAREREQVERMREVAQRDARLSSEVGDALAEASAHEGGGRYTEAIGSAERARALAEGGGASGELLARVDGTLTRLRDGREVAQRAAQRAAENQALLAELLEARDPEGEDPRQTASSYERVFQSHGIDIDAGSPQDVASALKLRGLGSEIALFFDSLTEVRRLSDDEHGTVRALEIAHAIDPDPLRADLREGLDAGALDVLRGITDSGFKDQPAITIELLGSALQQLGEREAARNVYRTGIERFPTDFSLQYRLGRLNQIGVTADMQEALECFRAALAVRPDSVVGGGDRNSKRTTFGEG